MLWEFISGFWPRSGHEFRRLTTPRFLRCHLGLLVISGLISAGAAFAPATASGQIFVGCNPYISPSFIGEYTTSGVPVNASLVSGLGPLPLGIAVSGRDLFVVSWVSYMNFAGSIGEYTTSGATVNASLVSGLNSPEGLAVSGSDLFVTNGNTIGEYTTSGATVNASLISGLNQPAGIAVSGSDLYVVNYGSDTIGEYTLGVTPGTIASSIPTLVSGLGTAPFGIAVSGSDLFVGNDGDFNGVDYIGGVSEYTTSGGTVNASLISGLKDSIGIAVSGSDLFVEAKNAIGEYTTSGATVNASLIGVASPDAIAVVPAISWASPVDGSWADESKWSPTQVPTSSNDVAFNAGAGPDSPYTVTLAGDSAVNNLNVQGDSVTIQLAGNNLTVGGNLNISGTAATTSSLILLGTPGGTPTVSVTGGVVVGSADALPTAASLTVDGATLAGDITNYGQVTLLDNPTVNGSITNWGVIATGIATSSTSPVPAGNVVTINGDFTQSPLGTLTVQVSNSANDTINVSGTATLAGSISIVHDSTFAPTPGTPIPIMHLDNQFIGQFTSIQNPMVNTGGNTSYLGLSYHSGEVDLNTTPTIAALAKLSDNVYDGVAGYGNFVAVATNSSLIPSQASYTAFEAVAYEDTSGSVPQIVVAFRGTLPLSQDYPITTFKNAVADVSFVNNEPTADIETSASYAASFVQKIEADYPNAFITLTGHSLGGALAQLVGQASGLSAIAFNAPGSEQLYLSLAPQLQIGDWSPSTGANVDYRIFGDQVSLVGTPVGTVVTLPAPVGTTFIPNSDPAQEVESNLNTFALVHSADTVVAQIYSQPDTTEALELNDSQLIQAAAIYHENQTIGETMLQLTLPVVVGISNLIDPAGGTTFTLAGQNGSPYMATVDLPVITGVSDYDLTEQVGGVWSTDQLVAPGTDYTLLPDVTGITFTPVDSNGDPLTLSDSLFFAVGFSSTGTFSGTLTVVPETSTASVIIFGGAIVALRHRRFRRIG